ncbi:MAG: AmmeMemoRadiSam system protein B [Desulfobaccales bacterium]
MGRAYAVIACWLVLLSCSGAPDSTGGGPFPPLFVEAQPFLTAIEHAGAAPLAQKITGITVPHHLLAADLIAEAFARISTQGYRRIIILSPDHFSRSRTPFAVARRNFQTVLGPLITDGAAVGQLLENTSVSPSNLFSHEHGVQALLPFVAHHFPEAKIVALAIRYSATPAQWRALALTLTPLLTPDTLIIQSTDFSHYLPAAAARRHDQETLRVLSGGDPEEVMSLCEPAHLDSKGAQYLQLRLQGEVFRASLTVTANRNSQAYTTEPLEKTTSYIVQLYSPENLAVAGGERWFFGGDTFFGRYVAKKLADTDATANLVAHVLGVTGGARLIVNLEGVVMPECRQDLGPFDLCMEAGLALPLLQRLNVRAVSLANNHSRDFGPAPYQTMVGLLKAAGITPLENGDISDFGDFRLAAFTDVDNQAPQKIALLRRESLGGLDGVSREKPLFAFLHWGREYSQEPGPRENALISVLTGKGVELIMGSHTHRAGTLIGHRQACLAFSLGNFIFDQSKPGISGALLETRFFPQGTYFLKWHPLGNLYVAAAAP